MPRTQRAEFMVRALARLDRTPETYQCNGFAPRRIINVCKISQPGSVPRVFGCRCCSSRYAVLSIDSEMRKRCRLAFFMHICVMKSRFQQLLAIYSTAALPALSIIRPPMQDTWRWSRNAHINAMQASTEIKRSAACSIQPRLKQQKRCYGLSAIHCRLYWRD